MTDPQKKITKRRVSKEELELWRRAAIGLDKLLADIEVLIEANTMKTLSSALIKSKERSHFIIKNGDLYAPRDLLSLFSRDKNKINTNTTSKQLTIENE